MADLHFTDDKATAAEIAAVAAALDPADVAVSIESERVVRGGASRSTSMPHRDMPHQSPTSASTLRASSLAPKTSSLT